MQPRRKKVIEKADKLVSKVNLYTNTKCLICNEPATDSHHWIHGRVNTKYRFDMRNIFSCCRNCHTEIHKGNISFEEVKGKALYWDLVSEKELEEILYDNSINKIATADIEEFIEKCEKSLKKGGKI